MSQLTKNARKVFLAALNVPPADRLTFLDCKCAGEDSWCRQVQARLRAHDQPDRLSDSPPLNLGLPEVTPASLPLTTGRLAGEAPGTVIGPCILLELTGPPPNVFPKKGTWALGFALLIRNYSRALLRTWKPA